MKHFLIASVLLILCQIPALSQRPGRSEDVTIERALTGFLDAFNNLDWPAFRAHFSDTPSIFHPVPILARRIDSSSEFEKAWLAVFERIKKSSGRVTPPYMTLSPQDLRIDRLSDDVALVTFHLVDNKVLSRRTLVLKKYGDDWKIVHLHASNLTLQ